MALSNYMDPDIGFQYMHYCQGTQYHVHILQVLLKLLSFIIKKMVGTLIRLNISTKKKSLFNQTSLTFSTLPVRISFKTWRTFTSCFMGSNGTYCRWTAWLVVCTRIDTTPITTCLIRSTFEIRRAS